jgi:hypothetical protein
MAGTRARSPRRPWSARARSSPAAAAALLLCSRNIFSDDEKAVLVVEAELVYPEAPATILARATTDGSVELHVEQGKAVCNLVSWDQLLDLGASKLDLQRAMLVLHLTTSSTGAPPARPRQGLRAAPPASPQRPAQQQESQCPSCAVGGCRRRRPASHLQAALQVRAAAAQRPAR